MSRSPDDPRDDASGPAARRWARDLAEWRIPEEILATAPQSPWIHPVELVRAGDDPAPDTVSNALARERLADGGVVLDVGCGGGRAALAVAPPASRVIGVDHQQGMLDAFAAAAAARALAHLEILGDWPGAAARTPVADVVVCHHVLYDVADLPAFATALGAHARRRVVVELPQRHPLAGLAPLWQHFWGLARPSGPTADDALAVVREAGFDARLRAWQAAPAPAPPADEQARRVELMRIRLCLTADRDAEVAAVLAAQPVAPRALATIWWDVDA